MINILSRDNESLDWKEDFSHENGMYQGICLSCRQLFYGHKRRMICKGCYEKDRK